MFLLKWIDEQDIFRMMWKKYKHLCDREDKDFKEDPRETTFVYTRPVEIEIELFQAAEAALDKLASSRSTQQCAAEARLMLSECQEAAEQNCELPEMELSNLRFLFGRAGVQELFTEVIERHALNINELRK